MAYGSGVGVSDCTRFTMARVLVFVALVVCLVGVHSAPQFGGSYSQANAQAGSFGGNRPGFQGPYGPGFQGPPRPGYGPGFQGPPQPGYGPGFSGSGFGRGLNNGGSISISKSISISRGGAGVAQSSAQSGAIGN